jgi:hypothetical protein
MEISEVHAFQLYTKIMVFSKNARGLEVNPQKPLSPLSFLITAIFPWRLEINKAQYLCILNLLAVTFCPACEAVKSTQPLEAKEIVAWLFKNAATLEKLSFKEIAEAASGKLVIPIQPDSPEDEALLKHITSATERVLAALNSAESPTKGLRRINEASKHVEDLLVKELSGGDFACRFPPNAKGNGQRSGYPDLEITHKPTGKITYLDPKLFETTARASSLRTFYFEPREQTLKITHDARHLLLGLSHDGKDGAWQFLSYDLVDLASLKVRLKAEFDASNREIYQPGAILKQKDVSSNKSTP